MLIIVVMLKSKLFLVVRTLYIFTSFSSRDVKIFNHDVWLKDFLLRELTQEYSGIQSSVVLTLPKAISKFICDKTLFYFFSCSLALGLRDTWTEFGNKDF